MLIARSRRFRPTLPSDRKSHVDGGGSIRDATPMASAAATQPGWLLPLTGHATEGCPTGLVGVRQQKGVEEDGAGGKPNGTRNSRTCRRSHHIPSSSGERQQRSRKFFPPTCPVVRWSKKKEIVDLADSTERKQQSFLAFSS